MAAKLTKAMLIQVVLSPGKEPQPARNGKQVPVQFNPQTLKLTYSNENKSADQPKGSASQFVGAGTSKLAVELLFDTSQSGKDVRATTSNIAYFIRPDPSKAPPQTAQQNRVPPGCRFQWGNFRFDGVVDSLQETLDYFSEDGVPLRSTLALGIPGIDTIIKKNRTAAGSPGTNQKTPVPNAKTVAQVAGADGNSAYWKSIAAANNIDDPLHVPAGTMLDLSAGASIGTSAGASASAGADLGFSAGLGGGVAFAAGVSAGAGAGVSAGAGIGVSGGASASAGVGATAGLDVSAGVGAIAAVGGSAGAGITAGIGTRSNAAGNAGGSFSAAATAGSSAGIGLAAG
jgi:Contractile injection system tube protein